MKIAFSLLAAGLLMTTLSATGQSAFDDPLLDRLTGDWVMTGTIAGAESTHDITAEWVLGHHYLRMREVSRESDDEGRPLYDAIVFFGWDQPSGRYACLWLDSTGGGNLSAGAIGYADPGGDELAFVFKAGEGEFFFTTFRYLKESDSWDWLMDTEKDGDRTPFARVSLTRK